MLAGYLLHGYLLAGYLLFAIMAHSFVIICKSLVCDLDVIRNQCKDRITSTLAGHYHCNKTYLSLLSKVNHNIDL